VRSFERLLAKAFRKASLGATPATIDVDDLKELIGRPRFTPESRERTAVPGVASGLAVTGMGGDVLYVEASSLPGEKAGLTLTGQLGDVMKESAQIALSWVRAHAGELGIEESLVDRPVHVHFPRALCPRTGRRQASR
jgi:ATP-dependent Lon protease